ncbi:2-hydroxychromene-2-carboxylate isomerase [Undibacterium sp. SXout20W]|uniref:2-hydroxychromene-2-carboxylate isomerase n=1 Tax=Undibacterium sp. SXout20W TaxID=3413051 RepID=UPI003BF3384E
MSKTIEFWFDFVSPYAYIASQSIEALAVKYGRTVEWKPILLGQVFKSTGSGPLTMRPPVMTNYYKNDFERSARYAGVPFVLPDVIPIGTQNTARVCLWLQEIAPERVSDFVRGVTRAYFSGPAAINDLTWLSNFVDSLGLDGSQVPDACSDADRKERLKQDCDAAIAKGIFGAPWIVVDGESFWGNDRLPQVEKWLATGGF